MDKIHGAKKRYQPITINLTSSPTHQPFTMSFRNFHITKTIRKILYFIIGSMLFMACDQAIEVPVNNLKETMKICIQPLGDIDSCYTNELRRALAKYYGFEVDILQHVELPQNAFVNYRSPRYRADSLIRYLKEIKDPEYTYIVGLTNKDISVTKYVYTGDTRVVKDPAWKYSDFGIFGLGFRPGPSCVISTFRLYDENGNEEKMRNRLRKIAVHELGHNLGLEHCPDKNCLMQDACEKISTIDNANESMCEKCRKKAELIISK